MAVITRKDSDGIKSLLLEGELGYDKHVAGGDVGRVYVGTGATNIALAKKAEADAAKTTADTHIARTDNPHGVTKAQVGLGNVDNTSDANKPVSTATQTALKGKLDTGVYEATLAELNLDRGDKYLANQNVVNMSYDVNGKLVKVQYNNATDVDYEVLSYNVEGKLESVAHYVGGTLIGSTELSYSNGKLVAAPFVGV